MECEGIAAFSPSTGLALHPVVLSRPRSPRYRMCLPVLYRAEGEMQWHEGVTVDLSDSGVLIDGEVPARADALVVLIPLLTHDGCLTGHGRIARRCGAADGAADDKFAVAVPYYQLQHQSDALASLVTPRQTPHQQCHHP
jgi:hypothetical protein